MLSFFRNLAIAGFLVAMLAISGNTAKAQSSFQGCYAQGHGSAIVVDSSVVSDTFLQFGVGVGCDYSIAPSIIAGASATYDFGDVKEIALKARLGYEVNPNLLAYGLVAYRMDGGDPQFDVALIDVGLGVETTIFDPKLSMFFEASTAVSDIGVGNIGDNAKLIGGLRYRFW